VYIYCVERVLFTVRVVVAHHGNDEQAAVIEEFFYIVQCVS